MYKFLISAAILVAGLVVCDISAQDEKVQPTTLDYEKHYSFYKTWSENLGKDEYWKDKQLKHKESGKIKKFSDLPAYEKAIFHFLASEQLTNHLSNLQEAWIKELSKFEPMPEGNKPAPDPNPNKPAPKEAKLAEKSDVIQYLGKLNKLRKDTAVRYEQITEKLLNDFKTHFSDEERQKILSDVKEYHDKERLIERK